MLYVFLYCLTNQKKGDLLPKRVTVFETYIIKCECFINRFHLYEVESASGSAPILCTSQKALVMAPALFYYNHIFYPAHLSVTCSPAESDVSIVSVTFLTSPDDVTGLELRFQ